MVSIVILLIVGTFGYSQLGLGWFNAFYMTLITISTVGFGELTGAMSLSARVFTVGLIMSGIFLVAFTTASFIETIVEGGLARRFGERRLKRQIEALDNHWIVCGFGRMGAQVTTEILAAKRPPGVVVLDTSPERVRRCDEQGILYLLGDATHEEVLSEAGIERAAGLVSLVKSDAENVFICLTARGMRPDLRIVARALEERSEAKLRRAGADEVISPYVVGGHRLTQAVLRPAVAQFLEYAATRDLLELEQATIREGSHLANCSLKNSGLRRDMDIIVLALQRPNGEVLFNPTADTVLEVGDTMIAMGDGKSLGEFERRAGDEITR